MKNHIQKALLSVVYILLVFNPLFSQTEEGEFSLYDPKNVYSNFELALKDSLKVVHLNQRNQYLSQIPEGISKFKNLQAYSVMKNEIKVLSDELFELPELKELLIRDNQIKVIPAKIKQLKKLEVLEAQKKPVRQPA
ncbi:hypothetical protein QQ054_35560 [Oscillatoria amoena NRMC-F 0135]|nr:hypothetical protein [Oscillatoria amoena NRMC-F 0135]